MPDWLNTPMPLWVMLLWTSVLWMGIWLRLGKHERELERLRGRKEAPRPPGRLRRLYNRFISG